MILTHIKCWTFIVSCVFFLKSTTAWDPDQLEVFDVVEELNNKNFYEFMNISQDANITQVKQAFRSLSKLLHPDKSDAEDADAQFRQLVSVYDVLKDPNKRKHYDDVLVNGLPNWKSAMYYYRHYRKMGMTEMIIILTVLITVGQYLIGWASYFEKKYTHEQVYQAKIEKRKKKLSKKGLTMDIYEEEQSDITPPTFRDTLPIQLPCFIFRTIWGVPNAIRLVRELLRESELRKKREEEEQLIQRQLEQEIEQKKIRDKEARKRKGAQGFKPVERDDSELPPKIEREGVNNEEIQVNRPITGGLWTDDDLAELIQLVKRYPGGTSERWERIAEQMCRSVPEVTYMAAKLKENCYRVPGKPEIDEEEPEVDVQPKKLKTRGGKLTEAGDNVEWTQTQQRALEAALAKHPKGPVDRWERIAKCVPDKTKEECLVRYKQLAEMVRKKKGQEDNE